VWVLNVNTLLMACLHCVRDAQTHSSKYLIVVLHRLLSEAPP
jgi:hypothetical protein